MTLFHDPPSVINVNQVLASTTDIVDDDTGVFQTAEIHNDGLETRLAMLTDCLDDIAAKVLVQEQQNTTNETFQNQNTTKIDKIDSTLQTILEQLNTLSANQAHIQSNTTSQPPQSQPTHQPNTNQSLQNQLQQSIQSSTESTPHSQQSPNNYTPNQAHNMPQRIPIGTYVRSKNYPFHNGYVLGYNKDYSLLKLNTGNPPVKLKSPSNVDIIAPPTTYAKPESLDYPRNTSQDYKIFSNLEYSENHPNHTPKTSNIPLAPSARTNPYTNQPLPPPSSPNTPQPLPPYAINPSLQSPIYPPYHLSPKRDHALQFPKYKETDPYLAWKTQCIMKAQAYQDLPYLTLQLGNKIVFNMEMDEVHSNVLKMATVDAYTIKRLYSLFSHTELPLISGPDLWEALDSFELRPSGHKSSSLTTVSLLALKTQLKTIKKNPTEPILAFHSRFSIQLDTILANNSDPGSPQEIALMFLEGTNINDITRELYKQVIQENDGYRYDDYNLRNLADKVLHEVHIYNTMYPTTTKFDMDGKLKEIPRPTPNDRTRQTQGQATSLSANNQGIPNNQNRPSPPTPDTRMSSLQ
eukprot:CAMPEP_0184863998 /NCGR_PEP_ID=MMETSP0580-20130426/13310_1 /TAXON_ID=1118495 /ORGANISM="Dactyliosolen fragilissimus" /LENGTH=577 /DNA_ID=CAMNT_0027362621 /DNA_START=518 /DNA_END=2251 /DNA_ORIENTATION=-